MSEPNEEQATTKPRADDERSEPNYWKEVLRSRGKVTWLGGILRDYGAMAAIIIFGIAGLISLGSLSTKVATSQAEILRLRDHDQGTTKILAGLVANTTQLTVLADKNSRQADATDARLADLSANLKQLVAVAKSNAERADATDARLANLDASVKQLVSISEKQTTALSQLGTQMANNTAVLAQLSKALDRLTGKLDSLQQTANENKNMLSRIDERTKNIGNP